ncbi:hypothetical protein GCM10010449_04750 [Streptomyces rectiviolaceus]|uniref:Uncharacterized protein n=1 Tax=Streptomyces rectiviolaceus TaxID=332591 RepID=A0ABP6MA53_9ACTN
MTPTAVAVAAIAETSFTERARLCVAMKRDLLVVMWGVCGGFQNFTATPPEIRKISGRWDETMSD